MNKFIEEHGLEYERQLRRMEKIPISFKAMEQYYDEAVREKFTSWSVSAAMSSRLSLTKKVIEEVR